jgi:thiamine pyrophosphate-dependent acetolactate synthase large subunit-like protein
MTHQTDSTVRDRTLDLLRHLDARRCFGNPGSTEIPLLADLPSDFEYVLALHEASAVAMAAGYALVTDRPAVVSLHTTAGLGNAVSALATARLTGAPLVVLVGQQDRRHVMSEPFLTGRLRGLAGDYVLETWEPPRAQDVPSCVLQAYWTAAAQRGPAMVIVPMDDWDAPAGDQTLAAPLSLDRAFAAPAAADSLARVRDLINGARRPVIIVGSGADSPQAWAAVAELAGRLDCPVWQEPFPSRPGSAQDDHRFRGVLPAGRADLRRDLAAHDFVLVVGTAMLRQYHYEPGPLVEDGTQVVVLTEQITEARHSTCDLAVLTPVADACHWLAREVQERTSSDGGEFDPPAPCLVPDETTPLRPAHVFIELASRLPRDAVVIEETPSSREVLQALLPARDNLGLLSAAMGGLGFAIPAAIGIRLARPARSVVAVVGDGSATYSIQALWTAARYGVGALIVVMDNGNYGVMNRLTRRRGAVPWPAFSELRLDTVANGFGCASTRVANHHDLVDALEQLVPALAWTDQPHVLVVEVPHESTDPVAGRL